ncbi:hypothetical protein [Leptospira kirschneri]|uniref:hypothetical protein n=1 Tax=Leptospira kirschneri TaxID=29507 RepID=UPI0002883205|nr:hypothetical protein [Leptospira kirschneri]
MEYLIYQTTAGFVFFKYINYYWLPFNVNLRQKELGDIFLKVVFTILEFTRKIVICGSSYIQRIDL